MRKPNTRLFDNDHFPASVVHSIMTSWAFSQNKPTLKCRIEYPDGSDLDWTVDPDTKAIPYKCKGEVYEVSVDTNRYHDEMCAWHDKDKPLTPKQYKEAVERWHNSSVGYPCKSVTVELLGPA